jgi:PPK2 family polyphosphate:nucleotide phosphotransferase
MKKYLVEPGKWVHLKDWDPDDTSGFPGDKSDARKIVERLNQKLSGLQEVLYAEHKHRLLVVLQAMDTAGKDGTISSVFDGVNPQGVKVASFKVPTPIELDHDYLWRVHPHVPGKGEIVIFNRSHYENVLVIRVHKLDPKEVWKKRFAQINDFEKMLAEEGVTILKFYLNIDSEEQRKRLLARLDDPNKHWKFNPGDIDERKLWSEYMKAYEEAISRTSQKYAPWYIIPANKKWYRTWVISSILVDTLEKMDLKYPAALTEADAAKYRQALGETTQKTAAAKPPQPAPEASPDASL